MRRWCCLHNDHVWSLVINSAFFTSTDTHWSVSGTMTKISTFTLIMCGRVSGWDQEDSVAHVFSPWKVKETHHYIYWSYPSGPKITWLPLWAKKQRTNVTVTCHLCVKHRSLNHLVCWCHLVATRGKCIQKCLLMDWGSWLRNLHILLQWRLNYL